MVRVEADDPILRAGIENHARILVASGGWIHDQLVIRSFEGEISVALTGPAEVGERLLVVPKQVLVPVSDQSFSLRGNEIVPSDAGDGLSDTQRRLLDIQCEIFNRAGKIDAMRRQLPKYALREHPALLGALDERRITETTPRQNSATNDMVSDFFGTRVLHWTGYTQSGEPANVLMSLIDYMNHHSLAAPYRRSDDKQNLFTTVTSRISETDECFVKYGPYDAQDLLTLYGFVDASAHFLRSASFEAQVEDYGTLRVTRGIGVQARKTPSDRAFDIAWSFPDTTVTAEDELEVSSIFIAGESDPTALKRALTMALLTWNRTIPKDVAARQVDQLAAKVVEETSAYYQALRRLTATLAPSPAETAIATMIDIQERILSTQRLG